MEINHVNGGSVDTNKLPEVDAILMEKSQELQTLFSKYNRQVLVMGEMKGRIGSSENDGCFFFYIGKENMTDEEIQKSYSLFFNRLDAFVRAKTGNQLFIAKQLVQPPMEGSSSSN